MGSYEYEFTIQADKQLQRLDIKTQRRIIKKLDYFCQSDYPLVFAHHLVDSKLGNYRFRIGNHRVIFDLENKNKLLILAVGHRREIYK